MKTWAVSTLVCSSFYLLVAGVGCQKSSPSPTTVAPVSSTDSSGPDAQHVHADHDHDGHAHTDAEGMAELAPEDRQLAEAQGFCVVTEEPLGSMGVPIKVMVEGKPVFVCCKGCEKKAIADPEKTLAKVEELQARVTAEHAEK